MQSFLRRVVHQLFKSNSLFALFVQFEKAVFSRRADEWFIRNRPFNANLDAKLKKKRFLSAYSQWT
jgi:hypothetical protein